MDNNKFCRQISSLCIKSILYEVTVAPKPGLVDRMNCGAHDDMDIFTFLDSASVLQPYFYHCVKKGLEFTDEDPTKLMIEIRPLGIEAEKIMFEATGGINTHKGVIFSFGVICAAVGSLFREKKNKTLDQMTVVNRVKEITKGISRELEEAKDKEELTYGEKLYLNYGVKGIRGEVEFGFETVVNYSLPILDSLLKKQKYSLNDVLVDTLLHLIRRTEDSNILGRQGLDGLRYAQEEADKALGLGGYLSQEGRLFVEQMDKDFIKRNISPGGAADLLGVTLLLYYIGKISLK